MHWLCRCVYSYFADTLANQEVSRHQQHETSSCDLSVQQSSDSIRGVHRPLPARICGTLSSASANSYNINSNHQPLQVGRSNISADTASKNSLGKRYNSGGPLSCGVYHVTSVFLSISFSHCLNLILSLPFDYFYLHFFKVGYWSVWMYWLIDELTAGTGCRIVHQTLLPNLLTRHQKPTVLVPVLEDHHVSPLEIQQSV